MGSPHLELVRSICEDWQRGDFSSAEWAEPGIVYVFADGPSPGKFEGLAGLDRGFRDFVGAWHEYHLEVEEYRELDAERVVVLFHQGGRGRRSGLELEQMRSRAASLFQVRNGKIARVVFYFDLEHAFADLGLGADVGSPPSQLRFDRSMVEGLERLYSTRDVLRRRQLVHAALGAEPGDRVLDVGCGPGFYVAELLDAVGPEGSVVGVDASPDMLAVAAKRVEGHSNAEFHEGPATALPVEDESFDRAVSVQVLEYVGDVPGALQEMRRVLRPGGRLVLWDVDWATVSWHASDRSLMDRALAAFDRHLVHPSLPQTLAAQLREAGFDDVQMDGHAFATNQLIPDAYGGALVSLLKNYVVEQGGMSPEDATTWRDEQRALAAQGRFFFSVTQFCFAASRAA